LAQKGKGKKKRVAVNLIADQQEVSDFYPGKGGDLTKEECGEMDSPFFQSYPGHEVEIRKKKPRNCYMRARGKKFDAE